MKVFALTKIYAHPDTKGQGAQKGDISSFKPLDYVFSKEEMKFFLPVTLDLIIPCGDSYKNQQHKDYRKCPSCQYFDNELCDNAKYIRCVWSEGGVLDPPKIIRGRRYNIDRTLLNIDEQLVLKPDKTNAEMAQIISNSISDEQTKIIITDNG